MSVTLATARGAEEDDAERLSGGDSTGEGADGWGGARERSASWLGGAAKAPASAAAAAAAGSPAATAAEARPIVGRVEADLTGGADTVTSPRKAPPDDAELTEPSTAPSPAGDGVPATLYSVAEAPAAGNDRFAAEAAAAVAEVTAAEVWRQTSAWAASTSRPFAEAASGAEQHMSAPDTESCEAETPLSGPGPLPLPPLLPVAVARPPVLDGEPVEGAAAEAAGDDCEDPPTPMPGRTCAYCRTQKTPLWRNGPMGAKTLCNACGVRFKLGKLQMSATGLSATVPPKKRPAPSSRASGGNPAPKRQKTSASAAAAAAAAAAAVSGPRRPLRAAATGNTPVSRRAEVLKSAPPTPLAELTDHDGAVLLMVLAGAYSPTHEARGARAFQPSFPA